MIRSTLPFAIASMLFSAASLAQPLDTSFTFQGRLDDAGSPASGTYDVEFALYDAPAGGAQFGSTLCTNNLAVADGLFAVTLDFGPQFLGQKRFLELRIRPDAGADCSDPAGYTILSRRELTAAPNAAFALAASTATSAATAANATNASQLNAQPASFYTNASNLSAGTLPVARLDSTVVRTNGGQTFSANTTFAFNTLRLANSGASFSAVLTANPSASRTLTLPDATGTLISTGNLSSITATGTILSGTWQGTPIGVASGGTGANLSGSGGAGMFLKQTSAGAALSVGAIAPSDLPAITLAGDVTGATGAASVVALRGRSLSTFVPNSGDVLTWGGSSWTPSPIPAQNPPVGGDLSGTSAAASVVALRGRAVSSGAPSLNDVLTWNGSQWAGAAVPAGNPTLAGDVTGTAGANTVTRLQGRAVSSTAPAANNVLAWTGSQWAPSAIPTQNPAMGGDLSGTASNAQIVASAVGNAELASDAASLAKVSGGAVSASGGNVTIVDPIVITATTRSVSVPPASFVTLNSNPIFISAGQYVQGVTQNDVITAGAGIQLPQGAVVTEFAAWAYDNEAGLDMTVSLYRKPVSNVTGNSSMASVVTSGASTTVQALTDATITNATVDNNAYVYFVTVTFTTPPATTTNLRLAGARVQYTVTSPLP